MKPSGSCVETANKVMTLSNLWKSARHHSQHVAVKDLFHQENQTMQYRTRLSLASVGSLVPWPAWGYRNQSCWQTFEMGRHLEDCLQDLIQISDYHSQEVLLHSKQESS